MDASALSAWLSVCLNDHVGKYNKNVLFIIAQYGTYGTGYLRKKEFLQMYLQALRQALIEAKFGRAKNVINNLWRDFSAHGIISPNEKMYQSLEKDMEEKMKELTSKNDRLDYDDFVDECEILDWRTDGDVKKSRRSSYELVELASDNKTPKRIREGSFAFVDEETCIGCTQCAQVAPSSFMMLENGRARVFHQSSMPEMKTAVSVCPVKCIHNVAFHELKELEIARDEGDGLPYGRKGKHIPLHVAGMDSDNNRVSSWYHQMKQKCSCPTKGCHDCPSFKLQGDNPHFQEILEKAEKVRTLDFMQNSCHHLRKTAEL